MNQFLVEQTDEQAAIVALRAEIAALAGERDQLALDNRQLAAGTARGDLSAAEQTAFDSAQEAALGDLQTQIAELEKRFQASRGGDYIVQMKLQALYEQRKPLQAEINARKPKPQALAMKISANEKKQLDTLHAREQEALRAYTKTRFEDRVLCQRHAEAKKEHTRFRNCLIRKYAPPKAD